MVLKLLVFLLLIFPLFIILSLLITDSADSFFEFVLDSLKKLNRRISSIFVFISRIIFRKSWHKPIRLLEKSIKMCHTKGLRNASFELNKIYKKSKEDIKGYRGFLEENIDTLKVIHDTLIESKELGFQNDEVFNEKLLVLIQTLQERALTNREKQLKSITKKIESETDILNELRNLNK